MFYLPEDLELGGATKRFRANVEVLKLLKHLRASNVSPQYVSDEQRQILCRYTGWGDSAILKMAAPQDSSRFHEKLNGEIKGLLDEKEITSLLSSTPNAHYTSLEVIRAIWHGLELLGLTSIPRLRFLDPSAGVGHFYGAAPEWAREKMDRPTSIELDRVTAAICKYLYPEMEVIQEGFERTYRLRHGDRTLTDWFDLVISNVPFGKVHVADPGMKLKSATEAIHNYFITRMLELVRPGGIVVAITSRFTLDGTTGASRCRQAWAQIADLVSAVRLPDTAFKQNAGTDVVTDVLFLRKRKNPSTGENTSWVETADGLYTGRHKVWKQKKGAHWSSSYSMEEVEEDFEGTAITNKWFLEHPEYVLGKPTLNGSMYGRGGSWGAVRNDGWEGKTDFNNKSVKDREARERRDREGKYTVEPIEGISVGDAMREAFSRAFPTPIITPEEVQRVSTELPPAQSPEIVFEPRTDVQKSWYQVYRAAKRVIAIQMERGDDEQLAEAQRELNCIYDNTILLHGRAMDGKALIAFKQHPAILSFLLALETPRGQKEAIFRARTLLPTPEQVRVTDPHDAMFLCLDRLGKLDIAWITEATGIPNDEVIRVLGDRIFQDPVSREWLMADEYLSGNVRRRLREAQTAAEHDQGFQRNVEALSAEGVQPSDLAPADIQIALNAQWIPADVITSFIRHLIPTYTGNAYYVGRCAWTFERPDSDVRDCQESQHKWGTSRMDAFSLLQCGLDGRTPMIYDEVETEDRKKKRVLNTTDSVVAQQKLSDIQDEYRKWLWLESERASRLCEIYNDRYNCWRPRKFDGSFLTFPGMNQEYSLRDFQKDGVARVLFSDRKSHPLFGWPTGAGKTFGVIASIEKQLQLGMVTKAVIAVPKHLVSQWVDDYRRLFPGRADQVLCAGKDDLTKAERGTFLARVATGSFRVVIMSHQQFKMLPASDETFAAVLKEQLDVLEEEIRDLEATSDDPKADRSLKQLYSMRNDYEAKIRDRHERTKRDSSWTIQFEELGFDFFAGDEAQVWKNLQLITKMGRVNGIRTGKNQISLDFLCKVRWLTRKAKGKLLLATATPIANSLAEAYVFASYLQEALLEEKELSHADAFFGLFTRPYSSVELDPSCDGYRVVSRLEFGNLPELVHLLRQSWHVVKPEDLKLKIPTLVTGQEIIVQTPGSDDLKTFIKGLAARATRIREGKVKPEVDNMLSVCSDGRWASLTNGNPALAVPSDRPTKLRDCAHNVALHWRETASELGTQLVFLDLGVPKAEKSGAKKAKEEEENESDVATDDAPVAVQEEMTAAELTAQRSMYGIFRQYLVGEGVPLEQIAFAQEHKSPDEKRRLYQRINDGEIRVLVGSTEVMSTGVNVQKRLIALHHLDPTWRPDGKTQRDGRIRRQGNQWDQVYIYVYLTEGSFDAYMWGLIRSKLRVIEQVMYGDVTIRRIDGDIGEMVLRASEIQALASGNPKVLEFVGVQNELTKLSKVRQAWVRSKANQKYELGWIPSQIIRHEGNITTLERQAALRDNQHPLEVLHPRSVVSTFMEDPPSPRFTRHTENRAAWEQMGQVIEAMNEYAFTNDEIQEYWKYHRIDRKDRKAIDSYKGISAMERPIARYKGFDVTIRGEWGNRYSLRLEPPFTGYGTWTASFGTTAQGTFQSLDAALARIEHQIKQERADIALLEAKRAAILAERDSRWEHTAKYRRILEQYRELAKELATEGLSASEFDDIPDDGSSTPVEDFVSAKEQEIARDVRQLTLWEPSVTTQQEKTAIGKREKTVIRRNTKEKQIGLFG